MSRSAVIAVLTLVICLYVIDILGSVDGKGGRGGGRVGGHRACYGGHCGRSNGSSSGGSRNSSQKWRHLTAGSVVSGCDLEDVCGDLYDDDFYEDSDPYNLTEAELKKVCLHGYNSTNCYIQHATRCIPPEGRPFLPLLANVKAILTSQWNICEKPDLYADYQAVMPCLKLVNDLKSDDPVLTSLEDCTSEFLPKAQSAVEEYGRIVQHGFTEDLVVNHTALVHGFCCGGKAVTDCGIGALSRMCSTAAISVIQAQVSGTFNSINCTRLTADQPCPAGVVSGFLA